MAAVGATSAIFDLDCRICCRCWKWDGHHYCDEKLWSKKTKTNYENQSPQLLLLAASSDLFVIFFGAVGLYPLLQFLGTPSAIVSQSYLYISTIVNGVAVTFAYNLCAGLRAVGDSLAALYFLIIAAILNILLDLYFITQLHLESNLLGLRPLLPSFFRPSLFLLYPQKYLFSCQIAPILCGIKGSIRT